MGSVTTLNSTWQIMQTALKKPVEKHDKIVWNNAFYDSEQLFFEKKKLNSVENQLPGLIIITCRGGSRIFSRGGILKKNLSAFF